MLMKSNNSVNSKFHSIEYQALPLIIIAILFCVLLLQECHVMWSSISVITGMEVVKCFPTDTINVLLIFNYNIWKPSELTP